MTKNEQLLKAFTIKRLLAVLNSPHLNQKNVGVPKDLGLEDFDSWIAAKIKTLTKEASKL